MQISADKFTSRRKVSPDVAKKNCKKIKGKQAFINNENLERKVGIYWFQNFFL